MGAFRVHVQLRLGRCPRFCTLRHSSVLAEVCLLASHLPGSSVLRTETKAAEGAVITAAGSAVFRQGAHLPPHSILPAAQPGTCHSPLHITGEGTDLAMWHHLPEVPHHGHRRAGSGLRILT